MRSLLLHSKEVGMDITGLSTRPVGIVHSEVLSSKQKCTDCILVFVTIENGDDEGKATKLVDEIFSFASNTGRKNVFISPFAHLSNNLAPAKVALPIFTKIFELARAKELNVVEGHFGSDKELSLHLYGHPGNVRFREF